MSEYTPEIGTFADDPIRDQQQPGRCTMEFLVMTVGAGVLILLFAVQALITLWKACVSGTLSLRNSFAPARRLAFIRMWSGCMAARKPVHIRRPAQAHSPLVPPVVHVLLKHP